jgi:hypothetical protein
MDATRRMLASLPVPLRYAVKVAVVLGLLGGAIGLVVGLQTYLPTAWAAMFEVGLPATLAGATIGGIAGSVVQLKRRAHGH